MKKRGWLPRFLLYTISPHTLAVTGIVPQLISPTPICPKKENGPLDLIFNYLNKVKRTNNQTRSLALHSFNFTI